MVWGWHKIMKSLLWVVWKLNAICDAVSGYAEGCLTRGFAKCRKKNRGEKYKHKPANFSKFYARWEYLHNLSRNTQ